jgi:HlyD family secretion protein
VTFTVNAFPGRTFTGTVARIEPIGVTTSNVVNYNVVATTEPTDVRLLPTMTATVTIVTEQHDGVTLVPTAAISFARTQAIQIRQGGGEGSQAPSSGQVGVGAGPERLAPAPTEGTPSAMVLVMKDGQPVPTRIQVGGSDAQNTEVLAGLEPGARVVTGQTGGSQASPRSPEPGGSILPVPGGARTSNPGGGGPVIIERRGG